MANKILDILEIDGIAMDIHSGESWTANKSVSFPTAGTYVRGAEITVTEPGIYLITGTMAFGAGSSTGITRHTIRVGIATGSATLLRAHMSVDANNQKLTKSVSAFYKKIDSTPYTFYVEGEMSKVASESGNTALGVYKVVDLGGVIRHLKSVAISMLNRPLNIGKAVA